MEEIKKEIIEKVILVAVADQDVREAEESLDELEELVNKIEPTAEFNKTMIAEEFRNSQLSDL